MPPRHYRLFLALTFLPALVFGNAASPNEEYNLMLAGGGLRTCSSVITRNCDSPQFPENSRTGNHYRISKQALDRFLGENVVQEQDEETKSKLNRLAAYLTTHQNTKVTSGRELADLLESANIGFDAKAFFNDLINPLYYALMDNLELPYSGAEEVDVSRTKSKKVQEIYQTFVQQAHLKYIRERDGQASPQDKLKFKIGVMTSSSRDPFEVADFYQHIFVSAAEMILPDVDLEVIWVPLDQTLHQAIQDKPWVPDACNRLERYRANNMSFNRDRVYTEKTTQQQRLCRNPELIDELMGSLHGLFINGGDQSLTRKALVKENGQPSQWLNIIQERIDNNHLILGGTSAGTAVQAGGIYKNRQIPMISSGTSEVAFVRGAFALEPPPIGCEKDKNCPYGLLEDDLTYNPQGGIGTFPFGLVDTHFSERDREARIALLAAATRTRFAFGVDEATALLVNRQSNQAINMKILGEGGVFIADVGNGIYKAQAGKHQIVAMSHFLNDGDSVQLDPNTGDMNFVFAAHRTQLTQPSPAPLITDGLWRRQVSMQCGMTSAHRWVWEDIALLVNPGPQTQFYKSEQPTPTCSYVNLLFGIEN